MKIGKILLSIGKKISKGTKGSDKEINKQNDIKLQDDGDTWWKSWWFVYKARTPKIFK